MKNLSESSFEERLELYFEWAVTAWNGPQLIGFISLFGLVFLTVPLGLRMFNINLMQEQQCLWT